ncbi:hypothetical protein VR44_07885, partial [Streptomyces katrae]
MNLHAHKGTRRSRARSRVLLASLAAAAALTGPLVATAPAASAAGPRPSDPAPSAPGKQRTPAGQQTPAKQRPPAGDQRRDPDRDHDEDPGREHGKDDHPHKRKPAAVAHGLRQFTSDNTFTPPAGVTSVFVQAWG